MRRRERVWRECELRVLSGVLRGGISVVCVVSCVVVGCLLGYVCGGWILWRGFSGGDICFVLVCWCEWGENEDDRWKGV